MQFQTVILALLQSASIAAGAALQPVANTNDNLDRRATPAACFDVCNNAMLEQDGKGKGPGLCKSGSAYLNYYKGCKACASAHGGDLGSWQNLFLC